MLGLHELTARVSFNADCQMMIVSSLVNGLAFYMDVQPHTSAKGPAKGNVLNTMLPHQFDCNPKTRHPHISDNLFNEWRLTVFFAYILAHKDGVGACQSSNLLCTGKINGSLRALVPPRTKC